MNREAVPTVLSRFRDGLVQASWKGISALLSRSFTVSNSVYLPLLARCLVFIADGMNSLLTLALTTSSLGRGTHKMHIVALLNSLFFPFRRA